MTPAERFYNKVALDTLTGCLEWVAYVRPDGYASFWDGTRQVPAHRWAYEHVIGPVPEGLTIDHLCRNRACVNPQHMEPVTHRENTLRGEGITARQARQTHCKNGHEFTPDNTYIRPSDGGRRCRTCLRAKNVIRNRERRARARGAA